MTTTIELYRATDDILGSNADPNFTDEKAQLCEQFRTELAAYLAEYFDAEVEVYNEVGVDRMSDDLDTTIVTYKIGEFADNFWARA